MIKSRWVFLGTMLGLSVPGPSEASRLALTRAGDRQGLLLEGEIIGTDVERFEALTRSFKPGDFVVLASNGGSAMAGIKIGRLVRSRRLATLVTSSATCTSACALIWVAGSRRILSPGARVGFHAIYREGPGRKEEVGVGNAMVGRYLTLLDLPERAVIFATLAGPDQIAWVRAEDRERHGIAFEIANIGARQRTPVSGGTFRSVSGSWTTIGNKGVCLTHTANTDGTDLFLAFQPKLPKPLYLSMANTAWKSIDECRTYAVQLTSGSHVISFDAVGSDKQSISGFLGGDALVRLFASSELSARLGTREIAVFKLGGLDVAWSALSSCRGESGSE